MGQSAQRCGLTERQWERMETTEHVPNGVTLLKILLGFKLSPGYFKVLDFVTRWVPGIPIKAARGVES